MYDVIIVGAGPAGLACGIEAKKYNLSFSIIEKGSAVNSICQFPTNMTFFSTPELLEIGGIPFVSAEMRPTRIEALKYYQRIIEYYNLQINYDEKVKSVEKENNLFTVQTNVRKYTAQNVVVSTGYFDTPNPYPVPGANLPKVKMYYDEPYKYFHRDVAVVGGSNSAAIAALELFRSRANVTLIHRGPKLRDGIKYWIRPDIENRIKAEEIKTYFNTTVKEIREKSIILQNSDTFEIPNDYVFVLIGFQPDVSLIEFTGAAINKETRAPEYNPKTMETSVKGLYIAGSIAGGRDNNKVFIENSREHGKLIVNSILNKR